MGRKKKVEEGYVYLIQVAATNRYKIGYSATSPEKRLRKLQTGMPDTLILRSVRRGGLDLEKALHFHFRHARLRGEWFSLDGNFHNTIVRFESWNSDALKSDHKQYIKERLESFRPRLCPRIRKNPATIPPGATL